MISGDGIDTGESPQIGDPGVEATLMWYGPDLLDNPTREGCRRGVQSQGRRS
jgi:hypothetical protein